MFDFIFKRKPAKSGKNHSGQAGDHAQHQASSQAGKPQHDGDKTGGGPGKQQAKAAASAAQQEKKQAALQQAQSLSAQDEQGEAAVLAFLQQCEFADARLVAAEQLFSKPMLEQALSSVRNIDRRVAKLLQQKLDAILYQQQISERANSQLMQAEKLLQEAQLTPNQVSELDRSWAALGKLPTDLPQALHFALVREKLAGRLQAQTVLQRKAIDLLAQIRQLQNLLASQDVALSDAQAKQIGADLAAIDADSALLAEKAALPRQLWPELEAAWFSLAAGIKELEDRAQALHAARAALQSWREEGGEISAARLQEISNEWHTLRGALPAQTGHDLQQEFAQWKQSLQNGAKTEHAPAHESTPASSAPAAAAEPAAGKPGKEEMQKMQREFAAALSGLEHALQEGSLQDAFEHDKAMRELKSVKPSGEQSTRLQNLRAELHRLQGWARWGGKVSREELTKAVEDLIGQNISVTELAKKVGSMRDRWRALDISAGPASRHLWERFDAACTNAYAPAAAHFKKLAAERHENAAKAQELVQQVQEFGQKHHPQQDGDWRSVASFCQRVEQQWHKLGTIERKERKRLDKEFAAALDVLMQPLAAQRAQEAKRREELIHKVENLNPQERGALDQLRHLQERWQEMAKALPLARRVEQELWQRFHQACNQVFARRKENAQHEQSERKQHLHNKEALCAEIEANTETDPKRVRDLLRDWKQAWKEIGPVPRNVEQTLEARFAKALETAQKRLDAANQAAQQAQNKVLQDKLLLCQQLEAELAAQSGTCDDNWRAAWQERWQALPKNGGKQGQEIEKVLHQRWQHGLDISTRADALAAFARDWQARSAQLAEIVLRLEIVHGIDSPPEFARQRLQMQVAVLQSSLKSGEKQGAPEKLQLFTLAASADSQLAERIVRLLQVLLGK